MTNADTMTRHLPQESLAAFSDGNVESAERVEVINHLASCDDCRALYELVEDAKSFGVIQPTVVKGNFGRRFSVSVLAAAAVVAFLLFTPATRQWIDFQRTGGVSELVEATQSMPQRYVQARLSGFPYRDLHRTVRSGGTTESEEEQWALQAAAARIELRNGTSTRELRGLGLSRLLTDERDAAIDTLNKALAKAGGDDPVLLNDLAAAYLERARSNEPEEGRQDADLGLAAAEKSWKIAKSPEAAWNRALAYELAGRKPEAINAWNDYLVLDPSSPWAEEARLDHLADLQETGDTQM